MSVAIWHQKHIRVKLNNELLTNEIEETDTFKREGSRFRGLAHVPDRSARVPSSARVPWLTTPGPGPRPKVLNTRISSCQKKCNEVNIGQGVKTMMT